MTQTCVLGHESRNRLAQSLVVSRYLSPFTLARRPSFLSGLLDQKRPANLNPAVGFPSSRKPHVKYTTVHVVVPQPVEFMRKRLVEVSHYVGVSSLVVYPVQDPLMLISNTVRQRRLVGARGGMSLTSILLVLYPRVSLINHLIAVHHVAFKFTWEIWQIAGERISSCMESVLAQSRGCSRVVGAHRTQSENRRSSRVLEEK